MPVADVLARINEIRQLAATSRAPLGEPSPAEFQAHLSRVLEPGGVYSPAGVALNQGTAGLRALSAAAAEIGVAEEQPGSNDSARIAAYRTAVEGSAPGVPWCAYFVSWAAAQAGVPIGEEGQGYGAVEQVHDWAARTGRLLPAGTTPQPGDLILFGGEHIGIVESVGPGGALTTVEGNHQDRVARVQRSTGEATGFVRLAP
ncbi:MAG: CHAP domain-containing protein [Gaiella sp.]